MLNRKRVFHTVFDDLLSICRTKRNCEGVKRQAAPCPRKPTRASLSTILWLGAIPSHVAAAELTGYGAAANASNVVAFFFFFELVRSLDARKYRGLGKPTLSARSLLRLYLLS